MVDLTGEMKDHSPKVTEVTQTKTTKDGAKDYVSFQVSWRDLRGNRQRRFFPTKREAALFASETFAAMHNHGASRRMFSTTLPEQTLREVELAVDRLGLKYSVTQAVDFFLAHHRSADFSITVAQAALKYQASREGICRADTLETSGTILEKFSESVNDCAMHEVTTAQVQSFIDALRNRECVGAASDRTKNNNRSVLDAFFTWASVKPQQYVSFNPVSDIKKFKIDATEPEFMTVDECERLMRHVETYKGGKYVPYFALALFAGIRPSGELEKAAAKGDDFNLGNGVIKITPDVSKVRKFRTIEIQPNLRKWLDAYPGEIMPEGFASDVAAIRKACSVGRDILRHTFISMHVNCFGTFAATEYQAGNSEQIIREHYYGFVTQSEAARFWQIEPKA